MRYIWETCGVALVLVIYYRYILDYTYSNESRIINFFHRLVNVTPHFQSPKVAAANRNPACPLLAPSMSIAETETTLTQNTTLRETRVFETQKLLEQG